MNWQSVNFDWNHVRAFLVTAEEGSLSAAARALRTTQPTLSRQVAALEDAFGVLLFERIGRTLVLTEAGRGLLDHVRAMGEAATRVSLAASGQVQTIEGTVSITATDAMSVYFLPGVVRDLRTLAPGLTIQIVSSNAISDLQRREADIAIRHQRPEQPDLIAKLVRENTANLYAASRYLDRVGRPQTPADCGHLELIGFDDAEWLVKMVNSVGIPATSRNIRATANSGLVVWEMVRIGLGVTAMDDEIAQSTPEVERVLPNLPAFPYQTWLTTHRELHTSRRLRLVFDFLSEALGGSRRLRQ